MTEGANEIQAFQFHSLVLLRFEMTVKRPQTEPQTKVQVHSRMDRDDAR